MRRARDMKTGLVLGLVWVSLAMQTAFASGGRMETPPPQSNDPDEIQAAQLMSRAVAGLGCEQAGKALTRLSNQILGNVRFATTPNPFPPAPNDYRGQLQEQMRRKWL